MAILHDLIEVNIFAMATDKGVKGDKDVSYLCLSPQLWSLPTATLMVGLFDLTTPLAPPNIIRNLMERR